MTSPLPRDWQAALRLLAQGIGEQAVDGWFRDCVLVAVEDGVAILHAPTSLHRKKLLNIYRSELCAALGVDRVEIEVKECDLDTLFAEDSNAMTLAPPAAPEPEPVAHDEEPSKPSDLAPAYDQQPVLNANYQFDRFVVGPCNNFAHSAAFGVAQHPGTAFNPLFLHGDVGLGKTHLMHGIAHHLRASHPELRVAVLSCEEFINHFVGSLREGSTSHFRSRYRKVDVLIVDDIQLLASKQRTQEEFFHTFNTLHAEKKQIVLSSDVPPSEIPDLQERLVSRFKWGLVVEIQKPCFETRVAILRRKADELGIELSLEIAQFLAEHIESNVRELEGVLTRLNALSRLQSAPLSMPLARQALGNDRQQGSLKVVRMDDILKVVIEHFGVRLADLQSKRRTQSIVYPRQVAMFLARRMTDLSLEEIGGHFGGRDHSTVVYAIDKLDRRRRVDGDFATLLTELERKTQKQLR